MVATIRTVGNALACLCLTLSAAGTGGVYYVDVTGSRLPCTSS